MTHKQYGLVFLLVAGVAVCWGMSARYAIGCDLLYWLAVSCGWVAAAFFLHWPEMLMGKRKSGSVFLPFCVINLPFLVIYWVTWVIRHFVFRHVPVNVIDGTNVSVSCWPGFHVPLDRYDLVVDVTSEMPAWYGIGDAKYVCLPNLDGVPLDRYDLVVDVTSEMPAWYGIGDAKYVCLPNLDGVPLDRYVLPVEIDRDMRILVHCAQGRGRSALVACLILVKLGYAGTADEAVALLKQSRPSISMSRRQLSHLEYLIQNDTV